MGVPQLNNCKKCSKCCDTCRNTMCLARFSVWLPEQVHVYNDVYNSQHHIYIYIYYMKYKERILDIDWSVLDVYDTCESYFSSFMNIFKSIYNESFPVMKTKRKYRNRPPWLTSGLKESIRRKNKLFRISLKHPTSYNNTLYREYKNMLRNLLKKLLSIFDFGK